jgi:hypothetical protein
LAGFVNEFDDGAFTPSEFQFTPSVDTETVILLLVAVAAPNVLALKVKLIFEKLDKLSIGEIEVEVDDKNPR